MLLTYILVLVIVFIASLVRSTLGFGESLIAVPLLLFIIPAQIAVPLSVLLSIIISIFIIKQDFKAIDFHSVKFLLLYSLIGIPLGIMLLLVGNERIIKAGLGVFIILYAAYSIFGRNPKTLKKDNHLWLLICGLLAGIFGGAYGLNGPPLILYGNMRQWSAAKFRATLQPIFLTAGIISCIGYGAKGLLTNKVLIYFGLSLIIMTPTISLGRKISERIKDKTFFTYVYWALAVIGVTLIISSISKSF